MRNSKKKAKAEMFRLSETQFKKGCTPTTRINSVQATGTSTRTHSGSINTANASRDTPLHSSLCPSNPLTACGVACKIPPV